jgi:hypothetical protein
MDQLSKSMGRSLAALAHIGHLKWTTYCLDVDCCLDSIDFLLGCCHPIHIAQIRVYNVREDWNAKFVVDLANVCLFFFL